MPTKSITGGGFQDAEGNAIVGGILTLQLSQDAVVVNTGVVVRANRINLVTDASGNIPSTPIWFNDELSPTGTYYQVWVSDSAGQPIFSGQSWIFAGSSPLNLNTMVPATGAVSYPSPELQQNKDVANGYAGLDSSALLKLAEFPGGTPTGSGSFVRSVAPTITEANVNNCVVPLCVGDLKTATGAAITTGTKNLTVSGATFTSADVGKSIYVQGAGAAGVSLASTIATFTNATHVVLADNAGTTISSGSVAYGTDCTSAIQTAFNTANSAGNALHIPAGNYLTHGLNFTGTSIKIFGDAYGATAIYCIKVTDPNFINNPGSKTVGIDISGSGYNRLSDLAVFGGMSFLTDLAPFVVLLGGRSGGSGNSFAIGHTIDNCFWINYGGSYTVALYGYEQCDFLNNHFESDATSTSGLLYISANNTPGFISPYTNLVAATTSMTKLNVSGARTVFSGSGNLVVLDQGATESCYSISIRDAFVSSGNSTNFLSDTGSGALRNICLDCINYEPGATACTVVNITAPAWEWCITNVQAYNATGFTVSPYSFANGFLDGEVICDHTGQAAGHSNVSFHASSAAGSILHLGQQLANTDATDYLVLSGVGEPPTMNLASMNLSSTVSKYNGIATVGKGIPSEVAAVDLTAQGASIGTTTLYAVPASGAGQYRLQFNAKVTRAATTSSTLGALTITYTDPDGTAITTTVAGQGVNPGTGIGEAVSTNTTSAVLFGFPLLLNAKASTNITYSFAYVSSGATSMQYNLHISLEAL
jgi:hypothetical protein